MLLMRKQLTPALSDLADLSWFPIFEPMIRIEDQLDSGRYTVRAELPGIDPAKDVTVTTDNDTLRLAVVRMNETKEGTRTEFHYGTFHRMIALPAGAKQDTIKAAYADGILQITMEVGEPGHTSRAIPIAVSNGKPKQVSKS